MGLKDFIIKKINDNQNVRIKQKKSWELFRSCLLLKQPAFKQHSQSSHFSPKLGWIGCAIQQATSSRLPGIFVLFHILIHFFKYKTIETHANVFLPLNISAVGSVYQNSSRLKVAKTRNTFCPNFKEGSEMNIEFQSN